MMATISGSPSVPARTNDAGVPPTPIQMGNSNVVWFVIMNTTLTSIVLLASGPVGAGVAGHTYLKNSLMSGAVAAAPGKSDTPKASIISFKVLSC